MRNLIIIGAIMVTTAQSVYCEPQYTIDQVIAAIADKESGGIEIGVHPDGSSYGKYGLTAMAVQECVNEHKLIAFKHPKDMSVSEQREAIEAYLTIMHERFKCPSWVAASGYYHRSNDHEIGHEDHGGHTCTCAGERMAYTNAIRSRLERHHPNQ